jgi:chromosomal replication initiation ATPase DnaA
MTARARDILLVASTSRERKMQVIARVAADYGVTVADIMGSSRTRRYAIARWVAMAAVQEQFGDNLVSIGRLFHRHHTSVLHGLREIGAA